MRKTVSVYGLTLSMPMLLWQLIFFLAPLIFLIALSFWTVRNFRMEPDFNPGNWSRMLGRSVFWAAYLRTFVLSTAAAVLTSVLAFPASYAIASAVSVTPQDWLGNTRRTFSSRFSRKMKLPTTSRKESRAKISCHK